MNADGRTVGVVYPKLTETCHSVLEDFKRTKDEAMRGGGETKIDIAIYMALVDGTVAMGHTEVIQRPLPNVKFAKAVYMLVRDLRQSVHCPWDSMSMCLDSWLSPQQFPDAASMAKDRYENPASEVQHACAVFTVDSEGNMCAAICPYFIDDQGAPAFGLTRVLDKPGGLPAVVLHQASLMDVAR